MTGDRDSDSGPTYSFEIPCPVTDSQKVLIDKRQIEKLIQQRANEICGSDPSKSFLARFDVLNDVVWEVGDGLVTVKVPIPVSAQGNLFGSQIRRGKRSPDVCGGRHDIEAKQLVDACIADVKIVQRSIQAGQEILMREDLSAHELAQFYRGDANPDLRRFIVEGGERLIQVDGFQMKLISTPRQRILLIPGESQIEVALLSHDGKVGDFRGKILGIKSGVGFLRVGNQVRLGYLSRNDQLRSLLHAARHFGCNVVLSVSQAVCVVNQKLATLEVKAVLNAKEIFDFAARRVEDRQTAIEPKG
ncbi:MAG: hypothetical protein E6Q78_09870 [Rhodoferax sp.]|nr:MAG: hypothetical protein E6Q78_09870 [Rhodoferax sp.]